MLDIDAIRARADAATQDQWWNVRDGLVYAIDPAMVARANGLIDASRHGQIVADTTTGRDAEFIAAARTDVPALCDEVERLRAALREIASPDCGRMMMSDGHYSIDGGVPQRIARRALGEDDQMSATHAWRNVIVDATITVLCDELERLRAEVERQDPERLVAEWCAANGASLLVWRTFEWVAHVPGFIGYGHTRHAAVARLWQAIKEQEAS